jgi:hypothetical protein
MDKEAVMKTLQRLNKCKMEKRDRRKTGSQTSSEWIAAVDCIFTSSHGTHCAIFANQLSP